MRRRTFEEMITYFNQTVSETDIDRKYKMTLLGMVTALLQKHDEDVAQIVRCKDCEYGEQDEVGRWFCRSLGCQIGNEDGSGYCADAERRTDGDDNIQPDR